MLKVTVKHGGRAYDVQLDVAKPVSCFKHDISIVTGVPEGRMKVMLKGILKDDADLSTMSIKQGQIITVIGTAESLPVAPPEQILFLEDMDDKQLARTAGAPVGLVNLGNTCYLNASLQAMRNAPLLRKLLDDIAASSSGDARLALSIRQLFNSMEQTTEAVAPFALLSNLRSVAPQFAETDQRGQYAQQDADEAWTRLLTALKAATSGQGSGEQSVDELMSIRLFRTLTSPEAPSEPAATYTEEVTRLDCNISINTNFLMSGIMDSLDQPVERLSPSLNRTVRYQATTRVARLPQYLTVHLARFYWRRDIQKKAKIMRKVKFPLQLDVLDIVTDELREKLQPANVAVKGILAARDDRAKVAKRTQGKRASDNDEPEDKLRDQERQDVQSLVDAGAQAAGANGTGLYELCAMVTHKGASADSGHYIAWTRYDDGFQPSGEEPWYKFDDDKVTTVTAEKVSSMDGGGEDSAAYILLYRSIDL